MRSRAVNSELWRNTGEKWSGNPPRFGMARCGRSARLLPASTGSWFRGPSQRPRTGRNRGGTAVDCTRSHGTRLGRGRREVPGTVAPSLAQMLLEEGDGALAGERGRFRLVAAALVAIEAMPGRVEMDLHLRPLLAHGLDVGERNAGVLLAEMQHGGRGGLGIGEGHH